MWTKIEDGLPPEGEEVLVQTAYGYTVASWKHFCSKVWWEPTEAVEGQYCESAQLTENEEGDKPEGEVIRWHPLTSIKAEK